VLSRVFRFADFELDRDAYALRRDGRTLNIERIPLELLFLLVERRGDLVTRAEILDRVWGKGVFVYAENAVNTAVRKLRRALNDEPSKPQFITTVPTKGYRFIGAVEVTGRSLLDTAELPGASDGLNVATPERLIVGREKELARLRAYFLRASEGARQMVFVTGEPGIGKTTVLQSFSASLAHGSEARIARGQCIEQYGSGEPYMPILEALTRMCNEASGDHVVEVLNRIAPSWLAQMPALLSDAQRERLERVSQGVTQPRMLREMAEALEVLTRETPLVLVFEDLHWSDVSTLELIAVIGRRTEPARLLVIGAYRPVEILAKDHPLRGIKEELQLQRRCEEMELRLLSEREVARYLSKRFPDEQSSTRIAPVVHQRTEGNPLFMVNVVDYLVEQGALKNPRGTDAPPTIQQMIQRNLERLDAEEQSMLEAASIVGAEFSAAAVAAAIERPLTQVETSCAQLARHEQFISAKGTATWPDGTSAAGFRFHHSLYEEVLYKRVPAGRRMELHRRIAEREESAFGERASNIASELAHHYRNAKDNNKAIHYLTAAGEQAVQRAAHADAVGNLTAAIELLSSLSNGSDYASKELHLQIMLGGALTAIKGFASPDVKRAYARARDVCKGSRESFQFPALYGLWVYYLTKGEIGVARELAESQFLRLAESVRDPTLLLQAHLMVGGTLLHFGDFATARTHIDQTLALYDSRRHRELAFIFGQDPGTIGRIYAGLILWYLGFPDQALKKIDDALSLASELQYPLTSAFAAGFAAWLHQVRGEVEAARKQAEAAIRLAAEYGFPLPSGMGMIFRGWALAELGNPDEGIKEIQCGREICEATGALLIRPYFLILLAEAYRKANRMQEGRMALTEAQTSVENSGERAYDAYIFRLQADLLQAGGSDGEAEQLLRSAVMTARLQNAKSLELRATSTLARLLGAQGRREEARAMLAEIYNWFTEGFETSALNEARSLLEQLK
jgi:DNA-binding winged helix-turn-helix (wHTH) protein/tetratricopeptide (TPR) repeat protein